MSGISVRQERKLPPAVQVKHDSARSIVFRDDRQHEVAMKLHGDGDDFSHDEHSVGNFTPKIDPFPKLPFGFSDEFTPLTLDYESEDLRQYHEFYTNSEKDVAQLFAKQKATVKTIKNVEWTSFLKRFLKNDKGKRVLSSFTTSTSLLPPKGEKMRCFGSVHEYPIGVVFALPDYEDETKEDEEVNTTKTYCWPSGYAAKTEFNIDKKGNLLNGRKEALVNISHLRKNNVGYINEKDHVLFNRVVKGGLDVIPYNEVYLRVGGGSSSSSLPVHRSFKHGVGLPIAMFVRSAQYGSLISLLRNRARYLSVLRGVTYSDENSTPVHVDSNMPLLYISPQFGVRIITSDFQAKLLQTIASNVNPFQNPLIGYRTEVGREDAKAMEQKMEELIDLNSHDIRNKLTKEECARIAGGFGATDESVVALLLSTAGEENEHENRMQDLVNEGLVAAVRSNDYHTSRQLLILYTLVASRVSRSRSNSESSDCENFNNAIETKSPKQIFACHQSITPPPPPPLDTDRLRSSTNSDGLLAVLGAAEILKAMQTGCAEQRVLEAIAAIEEWIYNGEKSLPFRLASWHGQRVAQDDLQIASKHDTNVFAFVSNKAIVNRRKFASQLRQTTLHNGASYFQSLLFLTHINSMISTMQNPCLRLELLQYILGLDNRYSVAHLARSVHLAATCLGISSGSIKKADEFDA